MRRLLCVLLLATACTRDVTAPAAPLLITTSVSRDSIRAGDTVSVVVTVFNRSSVTQAISGGGCGFFGFDVTNSAGAVVGAPPSQLCSAFLLLKALPPGAEFSGTLIWTGTAASEALAGPPGFVAPGNYIVNGGAALTDAKGATISQADIDHVPAHITIVP